MSSPTLDAAALEALVGRRTTVHGHFVGGGRPRAGLLLEELRPRMVADRVLILCPAPLDKVKARNAVVERLEEDEDVTVTWKWLGG